MFLRFDGMGDDTFTVKIVNGGVETLLKDGAGTPIRVLGAEAQALLEFFNKRQAVQPNTDAEQAIVNIIG